MSEKKFVMIAKGIFEKDFDYVKDTFEKVFNNGEDMFEEEKNYEENVQFFSLKYNNFVHFSTKRNIFYIQHKFSQHDRICLHKHRL